MADVLGLTLIYNKAACEAYITMRGEKEMAQRNVSSLELNDMGYHSLLGLREMTGLWWRVVEEEQPLYVPVDSCPHDHFICFWVMCDGEKAYGCSTLEQVNTYLIDAYGVMCVVNIAKKERKANKGR